LLGFHVKKNQGVRVSGWGSMMFHVFFEWTHHGDIRHQRSVFPPDPSKSAASGRSKFVDEAFPAATGTTKNVLRVPGFSGPTFLLFGDLMPESF
jgi:hypothetical protein